MLDIVLVDGHVLVHRCTNHIYDHFGGTLFIQTNSHLIIATLNKPTPTSNSKITTVDGSEIWLTSWGVSVYPIIYKVLSISGGFLAGFPNHQQYGIPSPNDNINKQILWIGFSSHLLSVRRFHALTRMALLENASLGIQSPNVKGWRLRGVQSPKRNARYLGDWIPRAWGAFLCFNRPWVLEGWNKKQMTQNDWLADYRKTARGCCGDVKASEREESGDPPKKMEASEATRFHGDVCWTPMQNNFGWNQITSWKKTFSISTCFRWILSNRIE